MTAPRPTPPSYEVPPHRWTTVRDAPDVRVWHDLGARATAFRNEAGTLWLVDQMSGVWKVRCGAWTDRPATVTQYGTGRIAFRVPVRSPVDAGDPGRVLEVAARLDPATNRRLPEDERVAVVAAFELALRELIARFGVLLGEDEP